MSAENFQPNPDLPWAITGTSLFDGEGWHQGQALLLKNDRILDVRPEIDLPPDLYRLNFPRCSLLPGFIDLQVNGAGGYRLTPEFNLGNLKEVENCNFRTGCTRFLPTLITSQPSVLKTALTVTMTCLGTSRPPVPSMLGIHLEGPYLNRKRAGIHPKCWIRKPSQSELEWIEAAASHIKLITLAPECLPEGILDRLLSWKIPVALGHSDATFQQAQRAFDAGICGVTHLFNTLPPLLSRRPGPIGAAVTHPRPYLCLIADGHFVHPANLTWVQRLKPKQWILVTDATAASGANLTQFSFAHKKIFVDKQGRCTERRGLLAGSSLTMLKAFQFATKTLGIPMGDVSNACSKHPAQMIGLADQLGRLAPGYLGDCVILDQALSLKMSVCAGKIVFSADASAMSMQNQKHADTNASSHPIS